MKYEYGQEDPNLTLLKKINENMNLILHIQFSFANCKCAINSIKAKTFFFYNFLKYIYNTFIESKKNETYLIVPYLHRTFTSELCDAIYRDLIIV